jgi:hypothetical protein
VVFEVMKKELDSNIIAEGLKLQADLLIKLNDENSKMNNAASKKNTVPASIKRAELCCLHF